MKKVYVCGDSFGCCDVDYPGLSWHEKLVQSLPSDIVVINLSKVCASNLLISLQVDRAIKDSADYVILLCTSVLRDEVKFKDVKSDLGLFDRFVDITSTKNALDQDLISYTMLNINQTFLSESTDVLEKYAQLKDLDLLIYKDKSIIENTLQKLVDSNIPFVFDQGGFENPNYGLVNGTYFEKFYKHLSQKNLWNYVPTRTFRPYYHLIDKQVTDSVAEYHYQLIVEQLA